MIDDQGQQIKQLLLRLRLIFLDGLEFPMPERFFPNPRMNEEARKLAEEHELLSKQVDQAPAVSTEDGEEDENAGVNAFFAAISRSKSTTYRVILRADVQGSLEALKGSLEMINSDKVILEILQTDVGQITKNDIKMAKTSNADVIGFNVKMENGVMGDAKHHDVNVFQNQIIYEIIDLVKDNMADLLEPELVEKKVGRAEIRQVFKRQ